MSISPVTNLKVCVILPAAGIGLRMESTQPKQLKEALGRPLISYTIEGFESISWVETILVVTDSNKEVEINQILDTLQHKKVQLAIGEDTSTRHRSIKCGVLKVKEEYPLTDIVIIHDAVRPFIEEENLQNIVLAAQEFGAAGVTRPLVSTVLQLTEDSLLDHSLDRTKYTGSEMPQAFRYGVVLNAYNKCTEYDLDYGTECLHLAQTYSNVTPKLIPGPDCLWKVTYKKDIYAVEGILKETLNRVEFVAECVESIDTIFKTSLKKCFEERNLKMNFVTFNNGLLEPAKDGNANAVIVHYSEPTNLRQTKRSTYQALNYIGSCLKKRGIVIHVFKNTDSACEYHKGDCIVMGTGDSSSCICTKELQRDIMMTSKELESQNICLNALVYKISEGSQYSRIAYLLADLVFNRNLIYTGQTFYLNS